MIIITPDAARELRSIVVDGKQAVMKLDAKEDGDGGFECSVNLVSEAPAEAEVIEIEGISVAFCGQATAVFAGAIVGLTDEGELALELAEGDCDSCCEGGSCDAGGGCCH